MTSGHNDPMAADRRVLVIALAAMLVLVGVGFGSAALFATSACGDIDPRPQAPGAAATSLTALAAEGAIDADETVALEEFVADLEGQVGELRDVTEVATGGALTPLDDGVAVVGGVTTVLGAEPAQVRASAAFEDPALIVGGGDRLYSLAYINPLTGQVDALLPLDGDLEPGTCADTAVIGEPFAFHLDAGDGELLLFRIEEDADTPQLELRDAVAGRRWVADLTVPVGPPGILAERVTAILGEELIVATRRVIPGEDEPAVVAVSREGGVERWQVAPSQVVEDPAEPQWLTARGQGSGIAVVTVAAESDRDRAQLVAVDLEDGTVRWAASPGDGPVDLGAVQVASGQVWTAWQQDGEVVLSSQDVRDGTVLGERRLVGEAARLRDDLALTSTELVELRGAGRSNLLAEAPSGWRFADALALPGEGMAVVVERDDRGLVLRFD